MEFGDPGDFEMLTIEKIQDQSRMSQLRSKIQESNMIAQDGSIIVTAHGRSGGEAQWKSTLNQSEQESLKDFKFNEKQCQGINDEISTALTELNFGQHEVALHHIKRAIKYIETKYMPVEK